MSFPCALRRSNCSPVCATRETSHDCRSCRVWNRSSIERPQRVSSVTRISVDLSSLGEHQDLLALGAVVLGTGTGFLPHAGNLVAGLLGESAQVPLLDGHRSGRPSILGNRARRTVPIEPSAPNTPKRVFSRGTMLVCSRFTSKGTAMAHRELLTESQRVFFPAPATDERGMVRHYTLSADDLALIDRRRSDPNRLGFAVMLCYLRFPGRILREGEQPPTELCAFIAEQLGLDAAHFGDYAERDQTRREHVLEIEAALGLRPLSPRSVSGGRRMVAADGAGDRPWTDAGDGILEELRVRRMVCPPLPAIERLGGSVRARAQRQLWRLLTDGLTEQQRRSLDQLLEVRGGGGQSTLAWLRQTAYAATTGNFPKLIERLNKVRALGIEPERAHRIHQNYWLKLAREGGQSTVQHLAELEPLRRYATLTALVFELTSTLTDESLNMFEQLVGSYFPKPNARTPTNSIKAEKRSTKRYASMPRSATL